MEKNWSDSKSYHWFVKKKLYHIPLWLLYETLASFVFSKDAALDWRTGIIILFYSIGHACGAYFNSYYLIPKYLKKKKYTQYIALFILNLAISPLIIVFGFFASFKFDPEILSYFFSSDAFFPTIYASSFSTIVAIMIFHMTTDWIATQQKNRQLEKEKLETELKFLRSQFNPHFLFNTINSIFFLIHKDQDKASDSLAKFSDLLRYQLYECNENRIELKKEIDYLKNFIELEKLRQSEHLKIQCSIDEKNLHGVIAPFILMPFVENAFKHVSKIPDYPNFIHCELSQNENNLQFIVENSIQPEQFKSAEVKPYSGIGLENVKRRLDLLYPEKYQLNLNEQDQQFSVKLNLTL